MASKDKGIGIIRRFLTDWDDPHMVAKTKVAQLLDMLLKDFPKPIHIGMFNSPVYRFGDIEKWKRRWFGDE